MVNFRSFFRGDSFGSKKSVFVWLLKLTPKAAKNIQRRWFKGKSENGKPKIFPSKQWAFPVNALSNFSPLKHEGSLWGGCARSYCWFTTPLEVGRYIHWPSVQSEMGVNAPISWIAKLWGTFNSSTPVSEVIPPVHIHWCFGVFHGNPAIGVALGNHDIDVSSLPTNIRNDPPLSSGQRNMSHENLELCIGKISSPLPSGNDCDSLPTWSQGTRRTRGSTHSVCTVIFHSLMEKRLPENVSLGPEFKPQKFDPSGAEIVEVPADPILKDRWMGLVGNISGKPWLFVDHQIPIFRIRRFMVDIYAKTSRGYIYIYTYIYIYILMVNMANLFFMAYIHTDPSWITNHY